MTLRKPVIQPCNKFSRRKLKSRLHYAYFVQFFCCFCNFAIDLLQKIVYNSKWGTRYDEPYQ
nr:MAG TPA: hypothetical protein [Caudoviricetes sp.]